MWLVAFLAQVIAITLILLGQVNNMTIVNVILCIWKMSMNWYYYYCFKYLSLYGRIVREGNDNLLQCSCLENSMERRAWWATAHKVAKSDMT